MIDEPLKSRLLELAAKPAGSFLHVPVIDPDRTVWWCNRIRQFLVRHNTRKRIRFTVKFKSDIIVWVIDRRAKPKPTPPPKQNPRKYKTVKQYRDAIRGSHTV